MKAILSQLQRKTQFQKEVQNEKKKQPLTGKVNKLLKSFDQYGQPFSISFEGETQYKTAFGGIISMIVMALTIAYAVYKFKILVEYGDYTYTSNQEVVVVDEINYNMTADNFPLIISVDGPFSDDIGYIRIRQAYRQETIDTTTGESTWKTSTYDLPFEECTDYQLQDYINNGGATYCAPKNTSYIIGGSVDNDKNNNRIFFQVYKCVGTSKSGNACKNDSEIEDFFATTEFLISFKNSYLAVEDFENPIQYYYNTNNAYLWLPGTTTNQIVYLQVNPVELEDGRFIGGTTHETLIQQPREKTLVSQALSNGALILSVQIQLDYYQTTYVRTVYTLVEFLSEIGGIKTTIFAIGWFFTDYFNESLKYASLIKRIYQFKSKKYGSKKRKTFVEENSKNDFEKLNTQDSERKVDKNTLEVLEDGLQEYNFRENFEHDYNMFTRIKQYFESVLDVRRKRIYVKDYLLKYRTQLQNFMTEREQFEIKTRDISRLIFKCFCCKSKESLRKDRNLQKYYYLNKGKEKIQQQFDIVEILRTIRQVKLMRNIFMNEYQRILFRYQRENLLESETDQSQNDDEIFEDYKVQKIKEKNPLVMNYMDDIVKNSVVYFERRADKLTQLDQRLIAGLIFRTMTNDQFIQHNKHQQIPEDEDKLQKNQITASPYNKTPNDSIDDLRALNQNHVRCHSNNKNIGQERQLEMIFANDSIQSDLTHKSPYVCKDGKGMDAIKTWKNNFD